MELIVQIVATLETFFRSNHHLWLRLAKHITLLSVWYAVPKMGIFVEKKISWRRTEFFLHPEIGKYSEKNFCWKTNKFVDLHNYDFFLQRSLKIVEEKHINTAKPIQKGFLTHWCIAIGIDHNRWLIFFRFYRQKVNIFRPNSNMAGKSFTQHERFFTFICQ